LKMPELVGRRGRWRRDAHLEVQVLKRRLLEEEEEMMEGIRRGTEASDTCRSHGNDDLDGWMGRQHGGHGWMDELGHRWMELLLTDLLGTPLTTMAVQLPPDPITPQILTNKGMMMMMMWQRSEGGWCR